MRASVLFLLVASFAVTACGPAPARPGMPPPVTGTVSAPEPLPSEAPRDGAVVGLLCADTAAGGMAVLPLSTTPDGRGQVVGLGSAVRQFSVYGWSGRRLGAFSVAGEAETGGRPVAIGSYAGSAPCTEPGKAGEPERKIAACVTALGECAVAVADIEPGGGPGARPYGEVRDPIAHDSAGACVRNGHLVINVDGAGPAERFPLAALVRHGGPPVEILAARKKAEAACTPAFAIAGVAGNRGGRVVDVLGVIDIDGDKRFELVLGYRQAKGPGQVAVYSATATPMRLDLVGRRRLR